MSQPASATATATAIATSTTSSTSSSSKPQPPIHRPVSDSVSLFDSKHARSTAATESLPSSEAVAIDQWFANLSHYERTVEQVSDVQFGEGFKEEMKKFDEWFLGRTENERTFVIHRLLCHCTPLQNRFFLMVLQQLTRNDPMATILSPRSSLIQEDGDEGRLLSALIPPLPSAENGLGENSRRLYDRKSVSRNSTPGSPQGTVPPLSVNPTASIGTPRTLNSAPSSPRQSYVQQPSLPTPPTAARAAPVARNGVANDLAPGVSYAKVSRSSQMEPLKPLRPVPPAPIDASAGPIVASPPGSEPSSPIHAYTVGGMSADGKFIPPSIDIPTWLKSLRLHKYTPLFETYTWDDLVKLGDDDLQKLGMAALGARRKILRAFEVLKGGGGVEVPIE